MPVFTPCDMIWPMSILKKIFTSKAQEKRIYLDYAATTPVHPEIFEAMQPYFTEHFGNPSSIHAEGVHARGVIERARGELAHILHVRPTGIIFTSGGTESNRLAIRGVVQALLQNGRLPSDIEIVSTNMEHPSVTETLRELEREGVSVVNIKPDEDGLISEASLDAVLTPRTALVTFSYVNSEIGVVQDVKRLSRTVRKYASGEGTTIQFHLDASQAPLWLPCELDMLGVDMLTLDAGKCYGPKGVGVLAFRKNVSVSPQQRGGGQEFGLRAGTESTPLIVGCVKAMVRAQSNWEQRSEKIRALRDMFMKELHERIPDMVVNGSRTARVANNVNISLPGFDTEFAVITLDAHGIAASTKSACGGAKGGGSKVVFELSHDQKRADATLRFTLGEETTTSELRRVVEVLGTHIDKMRAFKNEQKVVV